MVDYTVPSCVFTGQIFPEYCSLKSLCIGVATKAVALLLPIETAEQSKWLLRHRRRDAFSDFYGMVIELGAFNCVLLRLLDGGVEMLWESSIRDGLLVRFALLLIFHIARARLIFCPSSSNSIRQDQHRAWSARILLIRIPSHQLGLYGDFETRAFNAETQPRSGENRTFVAPHLGRSAPVEGDCQIAIYLRRNCSVLSGIFLIIPLI